MGYVIDGLPLVLNAGEIAELAQADHYEIISLRGNLWITQVGDERDTIVEEGQSVVLDRAGAATISALGRSAIVKASSLVHLAIAA